VQVNPGTITIGKPSAIHPRNLRRGHSIIERNALTWVKLVSRARAVWHD